MKSRKPATERTKKPPGTGQRTNTSLAKKSVISKSFDQEGDQVHLMGDDRPTRVVNVSVKNLRANGYENVAEWLEDPNHVYIGRSNRFVGLSSSIWANPFPVTEDVTIEDSLKFYRAHIIESGLINKIDELRGKDLGCWCVNGVSGSGGVSGASGSGSLVDGRCICHGHVILRLLKERELKKHESKPLSSEKEADIHKNVIKQISEKLDVDDLPAFTGNSLEEFLESEGQDVSDRDLTVSVSREYVPDVRSMKARSVRTYSHETTLTEDDFHGFREMNTLERHKTKKNNDISATLPRLRNKELDESEEYEYKESRDQQGNDDQGPSFEPSREGFDEELDNISRKVAELFPKLTESRRNMIARASFNYLIYGSTYEKTLMDYVRKVFGQRRTKS